MAELNCFGKTEHYGDKISLLNAYAPNNIGKIDDAGMQQAAADWFNDKLSLEERDLLVHVYQLGEDGISKFCRRRPPCGDYGDVDGDGWVSTKDLIYTARHAIFGDEYPMTPDQKRRADVNGDGNVTTVDVILIAKYIVGTYDTFAVCAGAPPTPPKPDCVKADINRDGIVDINDTILLGAAYGSHPGDPNWNPDADLNNDGVVDYKDMGLLGKCMGTVVTPPSKYLTPDEALLRIRAGEKCYIKCTLPILDMLPGIPYMQGIPILPGFAIVTES